MSLIPGHPKVAGIFDLDETITTLRDGVYRVRETGLATAIISVVHAGKKLFIVSGADPAPLESTQERYREQELQKKRAQLASVGIDPALFTDILVALPTPGISVDTFMQTPGLAQTEYVRAKRQVMELILERNRFSSSSVLSVGDRDDLEGVASRELGIPFISVPSASGVLPSDTLEWIFKTHLLGVGSTIPLVRQIYSDEDALRILASNPHQANVLLSFQAYFKEYMQTRGWDILNALGIPIPKIEAPNYNQYPGHLASAWNAVQSLISKYDTIVGIARKGLWLSFLFALENPSKVRELYVARAAGRRVTAPISHFVTADVKNKRILLLDNDALTARTVAYVAGEFMKRGATHVDALFVEPHCEPPGLTSANIHEMAFLDTPRVLGVRENGTFVIDYRSQLRQVAGLRRIKSLQDFRVPDNQKTYRQVGRKLGVV